MRARIWLVLLVLYLLAGVADGAFRVSAAIRGGEKPGPAVVAVAFCAGLFWPIDLVARPLLAPHLHQQS
jgi:hypothetical protein